MKNPLLMGLSAIRHRWWTCRCRYRTGRKSWARPLEAAFGISGERVQKVEEPSSEKWGMVGMERLKDIIYGDVMKSDVEQATAWFIIAYHDPEN